MPRPIVLLRARRGGRPRLAPSVAAGNRRLGVFLPYTPLHHLLLAAVGRPLVMTSGTLSEEPLAHRTDEALARLGPLADLFSATGVTRDLIFLFCGPLTLLFFFNGVICVTGCDTNGS